MKPNTSGPTCRPIIFSAFKVSHILGLPDGAEIQTRRVAKDFPPHLKWTVAPQELAGDPKIHPAPYFDCYDRTDRWCWWDEYNRQGNGWLRCPYGKAGDHLWVKEIWSVHDHDFGDPPSAWLIAAKDGSTRWGCPPPNKLQKLADKFGTADLTGGPDTKWRSPIFMPRWASRLTLEVVNIRVQRLQEISEEDAVAEGVQEVRSYASLWDSINAKRGCPWDSNPWVWALTLRRVA